MYTHTAFGQQSIRALQVLCTKDLARQDVRMAHDELWFLSS